MSDGVSCSVGAAAAAACRVSLRVLTAFTWISVAASCLATVGHGNSTTGLIVNSSSRSVWSDYTLSRLFGDSPSRVRKM